MLAEQQTGCRAGERKQLRRGAGGERSGRGSLGGPPAEFFCPISHCLMMEPVKILNTGVTINRTSAQAWMRTREPLTLLILLHSARPAAMLDTTARLGLTAPVSTIMHYPLQRISCSAARLRQYAPIVMGVPVAAGSQVCPVTGQPLRGWVAMESNDALRERIQQWVTEQGINISLLENAAVMMHDLCARVAR